MRCFYERYFLFLFTLWGSLSSPGFAAIQITGFDPVKNDRFANDAQFIANTFDLSGVGLNESGRWLTMVSENVYITAKHFKPASGSSVTFYAGNDPDGLTATRTVSSNTLQIGNTDLFLGTLSSPLDGNFSFYDFATEDITDASGGPGSFKKSIYNGADAYILGRSASSFSVSQDMAVGRNKLDQWFGAFTVGGSTGDAIGSVVDFSGDANFVDSEAFLQGGDSGAPIFVEDGSGGLTIVGINWFISSSNGRNLNGQTYIGNYDTEIRNFIDGAVAVPEPAAYACLLGAVALLACLVRRSGSR